MRLKVMELKGLRRSSDYTNGWFYYSGPNFGNIWRGHSTWLDQIGVQLIWAGETKLNHRRSLSRLPKFFAHTWKTRGAGKESSGYRLNELGDAPGLGEEGHGGAARVDAVVKALGTGSLGSARRGGGCRVCGRRWRRSTGEMHLYSVCSAHGNVGKDPRGATQANRCDMELLLLRGHSPGRARGAGIAGCKRDGVARLLPRMGFSSCGGSGGVGKAGGEGVYDAQGTPCECTMAPGGGTSERAPTSGQGCSSGGTGLA